MESLNQSLGLNVSFWPVKESAITNAGLWGQEGVVGGLTASSLCPCLLLRELGAAGRPPHPVLLWLFLSSLLTCEVLSCTLSFSPLSVSVPQVISKWHHLDSLHTHYPAHWLWIDWMESVGTGLILSNAHRPASWLPQTRSG